MEVSLQSFKKRFTYDPQKDLLGKGGFGEVYKAYDTEDHIFVALKISQGTTDDKYNLINEIKRFKKLSHPNIVKHIEAYEVNTGSSDIHGKPIAYHVGILEYANNGTLADLLKKGTPDYRLIEDLAKDIIEGLAYLHSKGIIHRDLKPTNILLFSEKEKLHAKITDFGIAKRTDATAASTQLVGTVEYMAPEFFSTGNITPAADVWSVGVMLLEALTGTHPFGKTTQGLSNEQIINNILNKDLGTATQNLLPPFKEIITRCLLRETNLRPQSAIELKGLLHQSADAFAEKTQVIGAKLKVSVGEKPKSMHRSWGTALFDFDITNGKWKWVIAKELFTAVLGLILIGALYFFETYRIEYFQDKYERKLHSELLKDFQKEQKNKWSDYVVSFAPNGCKNSNGEYVQVDVKFEDFKSNLYKIGSDLAACLRGNSKYQTIMDEMPSESIFVKLTNFNNRPNEYSFYRYYGDSLEAIFLLFFFLLYPLRLTLLIIFWVLKTLGFTFPVFSERTRKIIKYLPLIAFLLLLFSIAFYYAFQKYYPTKEKLITDWKEVPIDAVDYKSLPDIDTLSSSAKLPSPKEILGKDDPIVLPNESATQPTVKKKKSSLTFIVVTKKWFVYYKNDPNRYDYTAVSEIIKLKNLTFEKEYKIKEDASHHRCYGSVEILPTTELHKFSSFEEAAIFRDGELLSLFNCNLPYSQSSVDDLFRMEELGF